MLSILFSPEKALLTEVVAKVLEMSGGWGVASPGGSEDVWIGVSAVGSDGVWGTFRGGIGTEFVSGGGGRLGEEGGRIGLREDSGPTISLSAASRASAFMSSGWYFSSSDRQTWHIYFKFLTLYRV